MHWTERRRAQTSIGEELRQRGWTLYGWKDDKSDAMTDTYDPASWHGIAEKDGYVVVVDVSKNNSYVLSCSSGHQTQQRVPGDICPHCQGSGKEPDGWTIERAKASPVEFNSSWKKGGAGLYPNVVSPLMFDSDGEQKCTHCQGQRHGWKLEPVTEPWPAFQPNPKGRLWHLERDGRILASGVGLGPCADYDRQRAQAAVEQLVDRIEAGCAPAHSRQAAAEASPGTAPDFAVTIRRNEAHNGIEVVFSSKPAVEIRSRLKALGFRWSKAQGLWYARYSATTWQRVHALLEQELASTQEPQTPGPKEMGATPNAANGVPQAEAPADRVEGTQTKRSTGGNAVAAGSGPEPWQMSRLSYQLSRAATAGGVPILNARDGREHEAVVRQAVGQGLAVPPHVLAEYGLTQADILEVVDVYGRRQRISRHDYQAGYEQIRLYCDGADNLLGDLPTAHTARQAQGGAITLHRDNIANVLDVLSPGNSAASGDADPASPLEPPIMAPTAEPPPSVLHIDARFSYRECLRVKGEHPTTILLFRVGDSYEAFDHDADIAAQVCDLVRTTRMFDGKRVPLGGIPGGRVEHHYDTLRQAGHDVCLVHFDEEARPTPSLPTPESAVAPVESPEPPSTTTWTVLTSLRWKNRQPTAPGGIIEARNGDGQVHRLTPWGDGLWCMSCNSDSCHAAEAVLSTRPAARSRQAQTNPEPQWLFTGQRASPVSTNHPSLRS